MMNEVSDHISTGSCKTYDEYSKCCGIIEGLAMAERELLDLNEQIEKA
jgi:3-oxoacyl-[acyl-carrier-protein] synthase III